MSSDIGETSSHTMPLLSSGGNTANKVTRLSLSPHLQRILLRHRGHNTVQTQINNQLSKMIRDVPERSHRHSELRVRPGIRALDAIHRVLRSNRRKHFIAVLE